jgi:hypothetical protein
MVACFLIVPTMARDVASMTDSGTGYLREKSRIRREDRDQLVDEAESGLGVKPRKLTFSESFLQGIRDSDGPRVQPTRDPSKQYETLPFFVIEGRDGPSGGNRKKVELKKTKRKLVIPLTHLQRNWQEKK